METAPSRRMLILEEVLCFLIILLFLYAAVSKLFEYEKFQAQIGQSPLLTVFASFVVWFIPSVEIVISLMLIVPPLRTFGLYAAFSLMVLFTFYIIAILNFSEFIPCSCGGVLSRMGWQEHLAFNVLYVVACGYSCILHHQNIDFNRLRLESQSN